MKMIVCLLFAASFASASVAQDVGGDKKGEQKIKFTGGPIVEMNASGFIHLGIAGGRSEMEIGANVGGFLDMGIADWFSVQCGMVFQYKTSRQSWRQESGRFEYVGVEVPVYAMFHVPLRGGGRFSVGVGPYTDFGFSASYKVGGHSLDVYEKNDATGLPAMKDNDTGFGFKLGYEFNSGLQVNATYRVSVTNVIDANSNKAKMYPQAMSVGVAYRFGKGKKR